MSHTMNIETEIHDISVLATVCSKLNLNMEQGEHRLYDGTVAKGVAVRLPGWRYPAVVGDDGRISYDNYNGSWGKQGELGKLTAHYGLEKAKVEARRKGYSVFESVADNGNLQLKIKVGG